VSGDLSDWNAILEPGETVLWQGQSVQGLHFPGFDPGSTLFGLAFAGFGVFWMLQAFANVAGQTGVAVFMPLAGLPFVGVGLNLAGGKYFWRRYMRGKTWYSLTNRRAFVATNVMGQKRLNFWVIDPATIIEVTGDAPPSVRFTGARGSVGVAGGAFEYIDEATKVAGLMRQVQAGAV
jgi:hypothetical protein